MSKIDTQVAQALRNGYDFKGGNTIVKDREVRLHGHKIAWINEHHLLTINLCGYNTMTTKARLNAILSECYTSLQLKTIKGELHLVHDNGNKCLIPSSQDIYIRDFKQELSN